MAHSEDVLLLDSYEYQRLFDINVPPEDLYQNQTLFVQSLQKGIGFVFHPQPRDVDGKYPVQLLPLGQQSKPVLKAAMHLLQTLLQDLKKRRSEQEIGEENEILKKAFVQEMAVKHSIDPSSIMWNGKFLQLKEASGIDDKNKILKKLRDEWGRRASVFKKWSWSAPLIPEDVLGWREPDWAKRMMEKVRSQLRVNFQTSTVDLTAPAAAENISSTEELVHAPIAIYFPDATLFAEMKRDWLESSSAPVSKAEGWASYFHLLDSVSGLDVQLLEGNDIRFDMLEKAKPYEAKLADVVSSKISPPILDTSDKEGQRKQKEQVREESRLRNALKNLRNESQLLCLTSQTLAELQDQADGNPVVPMIVLTGQHTFVNNPTAEKFMRDAVEAIRWLVKYTVIERGHYQKKLANYEAGVHSSRRKEAARQKQQGVSTNQAVLVSSTTNLSLTQIAAAETMTLPGRPKYKPVSLSDFSRKLPSPLKVKEAHEGAISRGPASVQEDSPKQEKERAPVSPQKLEIGEFIGKYTFFSVDTKTIYDRMNGEKSSVFFALRRKFGIKIRRGHLHVNGQNQYHFFIPQELEAAEHIKAFTVLNALKEKAISAGRFLNVEDLNSILKHLGDRSSEEPSPDADQAEPQATFVGASVEVVDSKYFYLTEPLDGRVIDNLTGPDQANLRHIDKQLNGSLAIINGRVAVFRSSIRGKDRDLTIHRLSNLIFALLTHAEKNPVSIVNIDMALDSVYKAVNIINYGLAETTKSGKSIDVEYIPLPELQESVLFEPQIIRRTCPTDPYYTCNEVLRIIKTNPKLLASIRGDNNAFLQLIQQHYKLASLRDSTFDLTIAGTLEQVQQARDALIRFANVITQNGYVTVDHRRKALEVVLGRALPTELPIIVSKSSGRAGEGIARIRVNKLEPQTPNQKAYVERLRDDGIEVLLTQGPQGTGKTVLFLQEMLDKVLAFHRGEPGAKFRRLILSMPMVPVGETKIGALPGDLNKKTGPFYDTFYSHIVRILAPQKSDKTLDLEQGAKNLEYLRTIGVIEIHPLEFLQGKSFDGALIGLDEAENTTPKQMQTFLTRAETSSRVFCFGDVDQDNRPFRRNDQAPTWKVPSSVEIDTDGSLKVLVRGNWHKLGFSREFGEFEVRNDRPQILSTFVPRNGFAEMLVLYSGIPSVDVAVLGPEDILRKGFIRTLIEWRNALRVPTAGGKPIAVGRGIFDPVGTSQVIRIVKNGTPPTGMFPK